MQFSENFASTCAVTIPVLALAVVVEHRPAAGRRVKTRAPKLWWYLIQGWNLVAEVICMYVLIAPARLQKPGEFQDGALAIVGGAVLASMGLIIARRPHSPESET